MNEAHGLEEFAIQRYRKQQGLTSDLEIHGMLEGIIRNEVDHQRTIERVAREIDPDAVLEPVTFTPGDYEPPIEKPDGTNFDATLDWLLYDLFFEDGAQDIYARHAERAKYPVVREMFAELKRAEFGHSNEIKHLVNDIRRRKKTVMFFCPVCGFSLTFGTEPEAGKQRRCPMCGALVELRVESGNWELVHLD
ncbi:MAG: hypothetical protein ACTSU5_22585 [Promethearchaeota archaeon]